ncbi:MAG TPA: hypothetical protein DCP53_00585 [Elusimicrobia bacterium]|nr:MAG: hypothetical protein A2551_01925 [Elusimicrobia bacterium RIFOXYD2_FULL_34_30]HAM37888.1 hypothetical protein [Elusimicrobiota bacterium]
MKKNSFLLVSILTFITFLPLILWRTRHRLNGGLLFTPFRKLTERINKIFKPVENKIYHCFIVITFLYFLTGLTCLFSESFKILGTRPLGMGGAYVAIGEDAITQYWNPAGLGIEKEVDVQLPFTVQAELTGDILGSADRLTELAEEYSEISSAQKTGKSLTMSQLSAFIKGIKEIESINDPKKGVLVGAGFGGNIKIQNFAISYNNFTSISADPNVDIKNLGLGSGAFSPQLKRAIYKAESYAGVDLGSLIDDDYSATYQASHPGQNIYDTPTDSSLATSASTLSAGIITDITTNLTNLGIDTSITTSLPAGMTVEQAIANAIVNASVDPVIAAQLGTTALTAAEIANYVQQIEEIRPLVVSILSDAINGSSYAKNQSNLTIRGASTFEASLGYGREVPYVQTETVLKGVLKGLYAGLNFKLMKGQVAYTKIRVLSDTDLDILEDFKNSQKISNSIGFDLGLLLKKEFFNRKTNFGLLFRNINQPTFDQPDAAINNGEGSKYKVNPQVRGGVAIWPFNWWTVSTDIDLTNNSTALPGYKSRLWGLGNEFNLVNKEWLNFALRVGLMNNLSESSSKMAYTFGFGMNIMHFVIDLGAAMSSDSVEISDGTEVPSSAAAAVSISFDF